MAKSENQKLKLLYLMKIMLDKTDDEHGITILEIIQELAKYEISAERKSVYSDIDCLDRFGLDIIREQRDHTYTYRVGNRLFELPELKLLVDSVQAAKFITPKKTNQLIKKIEGLASRYEASQLQRQVYVTERVKTINENVYYSVDQIHSAISQNSKIRFQYFQWNVKKEMELRRGGAYYVVSPWALSWDDENYYLVAYDSDEKQIKHFRVDKMLGIEMTGEIRDGKDIFRSDKFDMAVYARKMFGMFNGEEKRVKLRCENQMAGVILDRFGQDVTLIPSGDCHFTVNVDVAVSNQFLAWVIGLGAGVQIVEPESVVEQVKQEIARLVRQYDMG